MTSNRASAFPALSIAELRPRFLRMQARHDLAVFGPMSVARPLVQPVRLQKPKEHRCATPGQQRDLRRLRAMGGPMTLPRIMEALGCSMSMAQQRQRFFAAKGLFVKINGVHVLAT